MAAFEATRRVEFCHTDAAGMMHFSAFVLMMEQAEHELLRALGLSVQMHDGQDVISWPRVSVRCDFRGAAHFEDELRILVTVQRLGEKSVTYGFQFFRDQAPIAAGEITAVCCRFAPNQPMQSIPIPDAFRAGLAPYAEPLA